MQISMIPERGYWSEIGWRGCHCLHEKWWIQFVRFSAPFPQPRCKATWRVFRGGREPITGPVEWPNKLTTWIATLPPILSGCQWDHSKIWWVNDRIHGNNNSLWFQPGDRGSVSIRANISDNSAIERNSQCPKTPSLELLEHVWKGFTTDMVILMERLQEAQW